MGFKEVLLEKVSKSEIGEALKNPNVYYVYVYLDPRKPGKYVYGEYTFEYEPFYVGKGKDDRAIHHILEYRLDKNNNKSFTNKIKKIQRICNIIPLISLYKKNLLERESLDFEISMISAIGRKDLKRGPLCNLTNGGDGVSGRIASDITKKKMSESQKGRIITDSTKRKISNAHIGLKASDITKRKLSESRKGINNPMYGVRLCGEKNGYYKKGYLQLDNNNPNSKKYNITRPDGTIEIIDCLKMWCRKNNLSYSSITTYMSRNIYEYKKYIIRRILECQ